MPVMTQTERHAIERGAVQNAREMVLDVLQERFPDAPASLQARVSELGDSRTLRNLHKIILRAHSIQDVEQHLR